MKRPIVRFGQADSEHDLRHNERISMICKFFCQAQKSILSIEVSKLFRVWLGCATLIYLSRPERPTLYSCKQRLILRMKNKAVKGPQYSHMQVQIPQVPPRYFSTLSLSSTGNIPSTCLIPFNPPSLLFRRRLATSNAMPSALSASIFP